MNCEQVRELLITHVCGELSREDETGMQSHFENCTDCKQEHREFRAMLGLMNHLPKREWNERIRIHDLLRRQQRWRTIVFSKAALWFITLTAFITVLTMLPLQWKLSADEFSVRWGAGNSDAAEELKRLQLQLAGMQKQSRQFYEVSETRLKDLVNQNNAQQQKRYWETMQMFSNYLQLQRQADMQKIRHEIATSYDRTGQEVDKTNELLQYVLNTSGGGETTLYEGN